MPFETPATLGRAAAGRRGNLALIPRWEDEIGCRGQFETRYYIQKLLVGAASTSTGRYQSGNLNPGV